MIRQQLDAHHRVMPVAVIPGFANKVADVPVVDLEHTSARQGRNLRVIPDPLLSRLLCPAHGLSMGAQASQGEDYPSARRWSPSRPPARAIMLNLFRACSENTRQRPGTAGNHRHPTTTASDRVHAGQRLFREVVAGVGFEPT
jgi:hypothetical protein